MTKKDDLFSQRKSLDEICTVPERIISVYSLEKHVWADSNSAAARKARQPEVQTIDEFQIDPVRPFMNDILRNIAAPYNPDRKDNPVGQGYWIQAEFGSGKSHLLCFLAALALGAKRAWDAVKAKEDKAGRGKRDSLYRFWEEGIADKSGKGKKGVFVIVKTLVGTGSGTVGITDQGRRLPEYILDAAKEQIEAETGKNLSLYPAELLADRFINEDIDRFRNDLKKFLRDPRYFDEDEFEDVNDFIRDIQQNKSPEYKRSCGNKLWRFYTEYLKVNPHIAAEAEDILKHLVETILAEGYAGVLLVLDEVSLFMKNRGEEQRTDDEQTLVVLSNRLAKVHNLPIWTVCAAQQAIESKMGVKNIIADDRLKLVKLLEQDKDYYDIVLNRVREIVTPAAVSSYYLHYKRGFSWPASMGEAEFAQFFPFHKPAVEVLRAVTYELTTTRSAIHFMHQTLKHQMQDKGRELIRLWELFDEAVEYEEDPSGVHAGIVAIKTKRETEYRAYESAKRQLDGITKGYLKVYRDKGLKTLQTLFLYHVARTRQQGITPEDIANSVLIERDAEANIDENIQHYETLTENLKRELIQIDSTVDESKRPRYRFVPEHSGIKPRDEFQKARNEAESNELMQREAWDHLLALDEWPVRTRQMTIDLSGGVQSIFRDVAPFVAPWEDRKASHSGDQEIELVWQGRQVAGLVTMRDLPRVVNENLRLPAIESADTDRDFAVFISTRPTHPAQINKVLDRGNDSRVLCWVPDDLRQDERDRLIDFAAYRKLVADWEGKDTEDALAILDWVRNALQTDLGKIYQTVPSSYSRGRIDSRGNSQMSFSVAGELASILTPLVERVLTTAYESRDIEFERPFIFRKEEAVKVINGIVKTGEIPKGAKPNQNISAAQNFGFGLRIIKKSAEKTLDVSDNRYVTDLWTFIDEKLADEGQTMRLETLYKNFMGVGGPKDYGLSRRMVQLFLLCLVPDGRVRITLGPRSGLAVNQIDYSNIADIDFSARVLDAMTHAQKMARPENWEVLRPYAEKLLAEAVPVTHDDAVITSYRAKLKTLFATEKDVAARVQARAKELFTLLQVPHPFEADLAQVAVLFAVDLSSADDIALILHALKQAFAYQAFDTNTVQPMEVDDLANRIGNYRDVQGFLTFEPEIRTAQQYCGQALPDVQAFKEIRKAQRKVADKLANLRPFIESEVKLKTELLGHDPPEVGETGTLGQLIHEYATAYLTLHDNVLSRVDAAQGRIESVLRSAGMAALKKLEGIGALQPAIAGELEADLNGALSGLFQCPSPSPSSVKDRLKSNPVHECGLTLADAQQHVDTAEAAATRAVCVFENRFDRKVEVFLSNAVRKRLEQGKHEPVIAKLLECSAAEQVREVLVAAVSDDATAIDTINRYLKRVAVKKVRMADFKPSVSTVEKSQIGAVVKEFEGFLQEQIASVDTDDDTLPVLQVE